MVHIRLFLYPFRLVVVVTRLWQRYLKLPLDKHSKNEEDDMKDANILGDDFDNLFGEPVRFSLFDDLYPKGAKLVPDFRSTEHATIIGMQPVTAEQHQRRLSAIRKHGIAGTFEHLD